MLHMGQWKLVRQNLMAAGNGKAKAKAKAQKQPTLELYDLATDPHEEHDVAAQHPEVIVKMQAIMKTQHTPSKTFPFPALD
jgi:arylsulfatase